MRYKAPTFLAVTLLLTSMSAFAGAVSGGGGKAVVCRDAQNNVRSVELLDLWEGRQLESFTFEESTVSVERQANEAISRLRNVIFHGGSYRNFPNEAVYGADALEALLKRELKPFLEATEWVKRLHGTSLNLTNDALELVAPSDCAIEQVVTYLERKGDTVLLNQDLADHMSPTQLAALYVHEALYKYMRNREGEKNSVRVRKAVALAFAGFETKSMVDLMPEEIVTCRSSSPSTIVHIFKSPKDLKFGAGFTFVPQMIYGISSMDYVRAQFGNHLQGIDSLQDFTTKLKGKADIQEKIGAGSGFSNAIDSR
ncbi:MAG: hypothetical protein EOP11_20445, partial [Proteobacteria bacterium]